MIVRNAAMEMNSLVSTEMRKFRTSRSLEARLNHQRLGGHNYQRVAKEWPLGCLDTHGAVVVDNTLTAFLAIR